MDYNLKDKWILWYHSITDNSWTKSSYKELSKVENFFDYQHIKEIFKQDHYQNGMFFYMKENIFPNWEDPDNRSGGCISFKVPSRDIIEEWNDLLLRCISNNILNENNNCSLHRNSENDICEKPKGVNLKVTGDNQTDGTSVNCQTYVTITELMGSTSA